MTEYSFIIFSVISWTLFVVYIGIKYGVQKSVSDSYYAKRHQFLFPLAMLFTAIPIFGLAMLINSWLLYITAIFISIVSATPSFKNKQEGVVHVIGALGAIIFGMLFLIFIDYTSLTQYVMPITITISYILLNIFKINNITWWIENIAYYCIMIGIISSV